MHFSKHALYAGIIGYSGCLLFFQDWPLENEALGLLSAAFLAKMLVDVIFAGAAAVRWIGPALFAGDEDDEDEVAIKEEDLHFSDTALYGFFLVNVLGNAGFHGYKTVMTQGAVSTWFAIWVMIEAVVLFLTWTMWHHASKVQKRKATAARKAKLAAEQQQNFGQSQERVRPVRDAS